MTVNRFRAFLHDTYIIHQRFFSSGRGGVGFHFSAASAEKQGETSDYTFGAVVKGIPGSFYKLCWGHEPQPGDLKARRPAGANSSPHSPRKKRKDDDPIDF